MTNKYHKRSEYEKLLQRLSKEANMPAPTNFKASSDYQLLYMINLRLIKLELMPYSYEEMELELH